MGGVSQWLLFESIFKYIDSRFIVLQGNMLNGIMLWVKLGFVTFVSIWIIYRGWMIATGHSREPLASLLNNALRLAFVASVAMVFSKSGSDLHKAVTEGMPKMAMAVVTGGYEDPLDKIDTNLNVVAGTFALLEVTQHTVGSGDAWLQQTASAVRLGAMGTAGPAVIGGALLLVYKMAMTLFIGFGPLFILFAGFKSTMQLFTKWLYYGIGTMFSIAVLSFVVAMVTKITLAVALSMLVKWAILFKTGSSEGINTIAMQQGGVGLIMSILLLSCPPLAAAFFNATVGQASAYNIFGAGGQQARDANGNPLGYTGGKTNEQSSTVRNDGAKDLMNPYTSPPSPTNQNRDVNPQMPAQQVEGVKPLGTSQRGIGAQNEKS